MSQAADSMEAFEAIRVFRPLASEGWVDDMESAVLKHLGAGVMDFHDETLSAPRGLRLLGGGELVGINIRSAGALGRLSSSALAETARRKAPQSFGHPASPYSCNRLKIVNRMEEGERQRVLVARLRPRRVLMHERAQLEAAVEEEAGQELDWKTPSLRINLAVLSPDAHVERGVLNALAGLVPERVDIRPGVIEPITITPLDRGSSQPAVQA